MGMFDGLLQQLETSPIVQKTIKDFGNVRDILVATVNRFDQRFGDAENLAVATGGCLARVEAKLDRVLLLLEHPSGIVPAGDDGLMKLLGESGSEMIVRDDFKPIPVVHETETFIDYNKETGQTFSTV